jgi:membrane-bound serine protease (ClpP class)
MLVDSPIGFIRVSPWVIVPIALATAAITFFLVGSILKANRVPLQTGPEAMVGTEAVADDKFTLVGDRFVGLVRTHGELWKAVSQTPVTPGQRLEIQNREGLILSVNPAKPQPAVVTPIEKERRKNIV